MTSLKESISSSLIAKKSACEGIACEYEKSVISRLSVLADQIYARTGELESAVLKLADAKDVIEESAQIRDTVLPKMGELRACADEAETLVSKECWPLPSYGDLLFGVR